MVSHFSPSLPHTVKFHSRSRSKATGQQLCFDEIANHALQLTCVPDGMAFKNRSFLRHRPDVVFYGHPQHRASRHIAIFGNVKGNDGCSFTDSAKGKLLDLAYDFMTWVQPERLFVVVFLTNSEGFQFYRVTRQTDSTFKTEESEYYFQNGSGWQVSCSVLVNSQRRFTVCCLLR